MKNVTVNQIDISFQTLFKIATFGLLFWLAFRISSIIIIFFLAYILTASISPFIYKLKKRKIPVALSVTVIYLLAFGIITGVVAAVATPFVEQTTSLINSIPDLVTNVGEKFPALEGYISEVDIANSSSSLSDFLLNRFDTIASNVGGIFDFASSIFGLLFGLILVASLSFYMIEDQDWAKNNIVNFFPEKSRRRIGEVVDNINKHLGAWFRGQLLLCLIIGVLSYIGLSIFQINYALPVALIAALLEAVPIVGPILTLFIAVFVTIGGGKSWIAIIGILLWFLAQQQLENVLIVPKVMQKVVGLNPVITVIAIMIGTELLGVIGAVIAIPIAATITILWEYAAKKEGKT